MEVPENVAPSVPLRTLAEVMATPGAVISGLRTRSPPRGPREELDADGRRQVDAAQGGRGAARERAAQRGAVGLGDED